MHAAGVLKGSNGQLAVVEGALVAADVIIDLIAVIARFKASLAGLKIVADHRVAAASHGACVSTSILVVVVAVIAGLALIELTVAAAAESTQVVAAIVLDLVTVVAALKTLVDHPIAADRRLTAVAASVSVDSIPVIAGFDPGAHDAVAARC